MAVDLGSTFKELIDEINSKSVIDSIDGLKGGTLSSPLKLTGGDQATAAKIALSSTGKGQITDENTKTLFGFMSADTITVGSNSYVTNIRGNSNSTIGGKKFSDLAVKSDIPNTSDFVKLSGDNTFTGTNIFSNLLSVGGSTGGTAIGMGALINVVGPEEMYTLNLPKQNGTLAIDGDYVKLTTDQTISGIKTFTSGSIVASKTDSSNKTMKVAYGCNGIAYTPYGTTSIKLISFPAKDGTFALTSDIPAAVSANPALSGSETVLTGLQIGSTKYKIPSGGGSGSGDVTAAGNNTFTGSNSFTSGINIVESDNDKTTYSCGHIANYTQSGSYTLYLPSKNGIVATTDDIPVPNDTTGSTSTSTLTSLRFGNKTYKPKSLYKHHLKLELYEKKGSSSSLKGYLYVVLWNSSSTKTQLNPLIISELKNSPAFFTTSSLTTPADGGPVWVFEAAYTTTGSSGYIYNIYLSGVKVQSNTGTPSPVFYLSHSSSADKLEIKRVVSDTIYSQ